MKKIGIIGENPNNDSKAIIRLLRKKFGRDVCQFRPILTAFEGDQLTRMRKVKKELAKQFSKYQLDFVIYLKDLDGIISETSKIQPIKNWFKELDTITNHSGVLFIIIYELEALILSDIETFNRLYHSKIQFKKNPLYQKEPKEFLRSATSKKGSKKKYQESHAEEIFKELDFQTVYQNHKGDLSFQAFIDQLNKKFN